MFEKAMRLNPLPPSFYYLHFGSCYRLTGRFEEAVAMFKKSIQLTPNNALAYQGLACTYGQMGREEEAKAAAAELLRINPKFSVEYALKTSPFKDKDQIMQAGPAQGGAEVKKLNLFIWSVTHTGKFQTFICRYLARCFPSKRLRYEKQTKPPGFVPLITIWNVALR